MVRFKPTHAQISDRRPQSARGGMLTGCERVGKISVKCQFAINIWSFCEKGECGALAMIYLVRFSLLGGPDIL